MTEFSSAARASSWERWANWVLAIFATLLAAALAEGMLAGARSPFENRLVLGLGAVLEAELFVFGFSLLLGAVAVASDAAWVGLRRHGVLVRDARAKVIAFAAAALMVLPLLPFGVAKALLAFQLHFKNQGLIAWSTGLVALFLCVFAALATSLIGAALYESREQLAPQPVLVRWAIFAPGLVVAASMGFLAFREAGIAQLDRGLLLAPVAVAVFLPIAKRLRRVFARQALTWLLALGTASLLATLLTQALVENALSALSRHGGWSRPLVALLRGVTDFDTDGYSGWFSGGDCAPFDPRVYPGAGEVPRDGIDNNCVAGDGGDSRPEKAPRPAATALPGLPERPNLLLITIETLRADRVSLLGYRRPTTPRLEELGKQSVVFEKTYATSPTTRLSLAALLSGQLPSAIHWLPQSELKQMRRIAPDTPWLPSRLSESGYLTLAVHTDFRAFTAVESAGFERGFQRFDVSTRLAFAGGTMHGFPAQAQVDRALTLLGDPGQRPWLLWTHFMEPHYLYEQPPSVPQFGTDEAALYDAEIAEADRQVGRLVDALRQRGLLEKTLILVLGDHGEEFGEHGARFHGSNLYEPQVRTAALLRVPGVAPRRVVEPISFVDLMPTLLDLMGLRTGFEKLMGRNLVPLFAGHGIDSGLFVENFRVSDGAQALLGFIDGPLKLIYTEDGGTLELYDLIRDPLERKNLYLAGNSESRRLEARLRRYLESGVRTGSAVARVP